MKEAASPGARIVIGAVSPSVDAGRYAVKRTEGDALTVHADIVIDGHEQLAAAVAWRPAKSRRWSRAEMALLENDRWRSRPIALSAPGTIYFRVQGWLDVYGGLARDLRRKREAGRDLALEAEEGRALLAATAARVDGALKVQLAALLERLAVLALEAKIALLLAEETLDAMRAADARPFLAESHLQRVEVERRRAAFASWYELFPRSQGSDGKRHGSLRDVIATLPRIREMGFDVLYMPPIHPIGETNRKGRNNALKAAPEDVGSSYAIGSAAGGHDAIHPALGTLGDFRALLAAARAAGIELALDFAVQMSPDHPWLAQHPEWFSRRPDGSIRYAENPPKTYEDIVNPDFYADRRLWPALRDILLFWAAQEVRIFRVDNPHTKPIPFWEWVIAAVREAYPDTIFLAEAFTRPKLMYQLAKIGFSQSYSYFTWRNTKRELTDYMRELTSPSVSDFFRPNFFVNTPDINPFFLQTGGRSAFLIRAALAATLSGLWGVYSGFELCEADALPGREEYRDSEKYELKRRDYGKPGNIAAEIAQLNALRAREPALQTHLGISFYNAFNDNILYYAKTAPGREDRILCAVNLDPHHAQECDFEIPLWEWGLPDHEALAVEDLLHGYRFSWQGKIQHLRLAPEAPYAIWRIQPQRERA